MLTFRRTSVLLQHLVSSLSSGDCSDRRSRESSHNLRSEQSPEESDVTRCCNNTLVLLKVSITVEDMYDKCIQIKNFCIKLVNHYSRMHGEQNIYIYKKRKNYIFSE